MKLAIRIYAVVTWTLFIGACFWFDPVNAKRAAWIVAAGAFFGSMILATALATVSGKDRE